MKTSIKHKETSIIKFDGKSFTQRKDDLSIEEPLQIKLRVGPREKRSTHDLSITMRTPGDDENLALGFLFTEGLIANSKDVIGSKFLSDSFGNANTIIIDIASNIHFDLNELLRNFYTTSSCGVCGKSSIELIQKQSAFNYKKQNETIAHKVISDILNAIENEQFEFRRTGGIHAAFLFSNSGELINHAEDVGRHNALDKLIGEAFKNENLPLSNKILLLSGRSSFELIQKAYMANIPVVISIGAPSSLAVELAEEVGMSLIGFAKKTKFNIYSHPHRINYEG